MNEFARARTACAVVARGLVCERTGNNFFTSVFPFAMNVVVVVVVARLERAPALDVTRGFRELARVGARTVACDRAGPARSAEVDCVVNMVVGADISACVRRERGGVCGGERAERRARGRARGMAPREVVWYGVVDES